MTQDDTSHPENDQPPFFSSWKGMYWLVIGNLALMIVLFYWLTRAYS